LLVEDLQGIHTYTDGIVTWFGSSRTIDTLDILTVKDLVGSIAGAFGYGYPGTSSDLLWQPFSGTVFASPGILIPELGSVADTLSIAQSGSYWTSSAGIGLHVKSL